MIARTGEQRTEAADRDKSVGGDNSVEIGLGGELHRMTEEVANCHRRGSSPDGGKLWPWGGKGGRERDRLQRKGGRGGGGGGGGEECT